MNKYKFLIFIIVFQISLIKSIFSQTEIEEKKDIGIKFNGFIKSDYWFDSRKTAGAREDLFALYPLGESLDKNGKDINDKASFNFSAITTRLTGNISGPDAFGAKTSGVLEADFSGVTNDGINTFRLRHAYFKLNWEKQEILMGQFWHPMFVTEVFPSVISLNTGAPFQPFNRNPLIMWTYKMNKLYFKTSAIAQRDYSNDGPLGKNGMYMRNSLSPDFNFQIQYKSEKQVAGVGVDYKILMPKTVTDSNTVTNETFSSWSALCYYKFTQNKFTVKLKGIYGQNMTDLSLMGGYAVKSIDTLTGAETYTPTQNLTSWINFLYGKKIQAGLFCGFTRNLGTVDENIGKYYALGSNIDMVYRVAPSISFISEKVQFSLETEYTTAYYGNPDSHGIPQNANPFSNLRILFTGFYFF